MKDGGKESGVSGMFIHPESLRMLFIGLSQRLSGVGGTFKQTDRQLQTRRTTRIHTDVHVGPYTHSAVLIHSTKPTQIYSKTVRDNCVNCLNTHRLIFEETSRYRVTSTVYSNHKIQRWVRVAAI